MAAQHSSLPRRSYALLRAGVVRDHAQRAGAAHLWARVGNADSPNVAFDLCWHRLSGQSIDADG